MATMSDVEIRRVLYRLIDLIDYYNRTILLDNCNNCGRRLNCKFSPEVGEMVRINCPLWEKAIAEMESEE